MTDLPQVHKGEGNITCRPDGIKGENLYCPCQRILSKQGKDNWDDIEWDDD